MKSNETTLAAASWATECGRGCNVRANYQSTTVHLPPALATGNLDIIPNAHAREAIMGRDGEATGLLFVDKKTGREERVLPGRVVRSENTALGVLKLGVCNLV